MTILADFELKVLIQQNMITYCSLNQIREIEGVGRIISKGLSAFGVDITAGNTYKLPNPSFTGIIDPKNPDPDAWVTVQAENHVPVIVPGLTAALLNSVEHFNMPRSIIGLCFGKSTYARSGLICNITPLEPGWRGHLTIEVFNSFKNPILIYPNEGICQIAFFKGEVPDVDYATKGGKYQDQEAAPVLSKV